MIPIQRLSWKYCHKELKPIASHPSNAWALSAFRTICLSVTMTSLTQKRKIHSILCVFVAFISLLPIHKGLLLLELLFSFSPLPGTQFRCLLLPRLRSHTIFFLKKEQRHACCLHTCYVFTLPVFHAPSLCLPDWQPPFSTSFTTSQLPSGFLSRVMKTLSERPVRPSDCQILLAFIKVP